MDYNYWNDYYKKIKSNESIQSASLFAKFVLPQLKQNSKLIELGCGNGRDCLFFANNGVNVTAIDMTESAVNSVKEKNNCGELLKVYQDDFVSTPLLSEERFDSIYSRFTIHSIDEKQEKILIKNTYSALRNEGRFYIEVRGVNDDIFGLGECVGRNAYIYNEHYRRFIVLDELVSELKEVGYVIISAEEKRGFAPFGNEDPMVIRIIAEKLI